MTLENREIGVGALVMVALIGLISYLNSGHDTVASAVDGTRVTAGFNRVDGLTEGSGVYLSGIKVGIVEKMWLSDNFRAVVTIRIKDDVVLPKDSSAAIHTDGLFGSKFVTLEPGAEDAALADGDRISFTQDAVVVSDLLDLIISEGRANRAESTVAQ